jgi:hypothetical protein
MTIEIEGRLAALGDVRPLPNGTPVRECVVETREVWKDGSTHANPIAIEFRGSRAPLLDAHAVGDEVRVKADIQGRIARTTGRRFVTLSGWRIEAAPAPAQPQAPNP